MAGGAITRLRLFHIYLWIDLAALAAMLPQQFPQGPQPEGEGIRGFSLVPGGAIELFFMAHLRADLCANDTSSSGT